MFWAPVDPAQLEEALHLSPTERLERLQQLVDFRQQVSLDVLERSKRAVGRAKDLRDLEAIRELRRGGG